MLRQPRALLVVAAALAAAVALGGGAEATVVTTCMAASDSDRHVNYEFCVAELSRHRDSPGADDWGLAKVAANLGVNGAGNALVDIDVMLSEEPPLDAARADLLRRCRKLYNETESAFMGAFDEINARNYTAGMRMAADATALVRRCDAAFEEAAILPPERLVQRGTYAMEIVTVCTAIVRNLTKPKP
ncbi:hypothetical protein ACP4OV_028195 [Aristida adscensionis]